MADAQRLAGFGLAATALPPGCEVVGAPPSLWREYRNTVLITGLVLLLQAATIVALVLQRRRRRAAEAEVMERRIELNRATRFAAMGELSASIAHEIGQPLGAILSNAEAAEMMLDSGRADESQLRAILADIRRDDLRAHEVIRRLRALLQKQQPEHAPLDLHETLVDALELIEPEARRRGMRIERSLTATNAHLVGDHIQMQQVLLNLALNAMDAMADTAPPQRSLKVATTDRDGGIELSVADQGHGVADEHRGRLFDSFFTTKPRGMGMGLSIVRTIVEAHDGRIQAEPGSGGGGTVFRVWLPRRVATEPVPLAQPQSAFRQVPA